MGFNVAYNQNKGFRLLAIYERLNKGELLDKTSLAQSFNVTPKTIQRDIDDLRAYLSETHMFENEVAIKYDKVKKGYYLVRVEREWLTNQEVLSLCKILLESRAFQKEELQVLIAKLMKQIVPKDQKSVQELICSEYQYYVPMRHNKKLLTPIWELSLFATHNEIISFTYVRQDHTIREHKVKPITIMFSEYYFYLIAYMADDSKEYPTVFRIDRMTEIKGTKEKFIVPYGKRFNEGEFRKRVQFMYPGELRKVNFKYFGSSIEAVLDRLPTAKIIREINGVYTIQAEVFGEGIYMWLRSQGCNVKIIQSDMGE